MVRQAPQHPVSQKPNRKRHPKAEQRKQRVLPHKQPSQTESIADAVVIKDEDIFFLSARDGQVPLRGQHGFGLYFHDCRYLYGCEAADPGARPV
jgi:hypothetical protein